MHSQEDRPHLSRLQARRAAGAALLLLGWLLGLALALEHRVAHAGVGHAHEPHLVGGQHDEGDLQGQLVEQAGRGDSLAALRVTVKTALTVPALPSVTVTSLIARLGSGSSLTMVPTPWPSTTTALTTLVTLTKKVSLGSLSRSPLTSTVKV